MRILSGFPVIGERIPAHMRNFQPFGIRDTQDFSGADAESLDTGCLLTRCEEQLQTEADTEKRDMGCGGLSDDIDESVLVKAVHRVAKGADTRENDMVCG